jgi:hypothetical protein
MAKPVISRDKELQKCTKQELLAIIQGRDAEASERIEALAKAEGKNKQLRTTLVSKACAT